MRDSTTIQQIQSIKHAVSINSLEWALMIVFGLFILLQLIIIIRNPTWISKFAVWIKHSAEGENKTASGRRLSAFVITVVCYIGGQIAFMINGFVKDWDPQWFLWARVLDIVIIGLFWGFINQQTLVQLKNGSQLFTNTKTQSTVSKIETTVSQPKSEEDEPK